MASSLLPASRPNLAAQELADRLLLELAARALGDRVELARGARPVPGMQAGFHRHGRELGVEGIGIAVEHGARAVEITRGSRPVAPLRRCGGPPERRLFLAVQRRVGEIFGAQLGFAVQHPRGAAQRLELRPCFQVGLVAGQHAEQA